MKKIDSRSAQVHFLFEGLLTGELNSFTPSQKEIMLFAMSKAFPDLKKRQKEVSKIQEKEDGFRGYNRQGKRGKSSHSEEQGSLSALSLVVLWFKRVCYVCIGLLLVILGWSIYQQYF